MRGRPWRVGRLGLDAQLELGGNLGDGTLPAALKYHRVEDALGLLGKL
jgi:hypothetical protein